MLLFFISIFDNRLIAWMESWSFPGESMNSTGFPSPSTMAWIFVFNPPRESPTAFFVPFFSLRWRFDAPWRKLNQYSSFPYLRRWSVCDRQLPILHRHAICKISSIRFSMNHNVEVVLAMALRFLLSREARSAWCGCPCPVSLFCRFVLAVTKLQPLTIHHLLFHVFSYVYILHNTSYLCNIHF